MKLYKQPVIAILIICLTFITGCDDPSAQKKLDAEIQKIESKLLEVKKAEAPQYAPDDYNRVLTTYNALKKDINSKKLDTAIKKQSTFYELADLAIETALKNKKTKPEEPTPTTPPEITKKAPSHTIHTVNKGDYLWKLSRQYYKKGALWHVIYNANKDKIKKPELIYPNQNLKIPPTPK